MSSVNRGAQEYRTLSDAMNTRTPRCSGDWRYIQERDQIDSDDLQEMRRLCNACPLKGLCRSYAEAARPSAGMWAGRFWGRRERVHKIGGEA